MATPLPWDHELVVGGIYILLYIRNDPPLPNDFYWAMYVHTAPKAGVKYHIKTLGDGWIADHGSNRAVFNEFLPIGLFQIARVQPEEGEFAKLDALARTWDSEVNDHDFTCRVWLIWVFRLMKERGILECVDIGELELEAMAFGNEHASDAALGKQPRPVAASKLCGLK